MIVNNGAADLGGAIMLDDASNVRDHQQHDRQQRHDRLVGELAIGEPHARRPGLGGERPAVPGDAATRAVPDAAPPDFSNPVALFNNIFWNNDALTLEPVRPGRDAGRQRVHRLRDPRRRRHHQRRHLHPALLGPDQRPDPAARTAVLARAARAARATSSASTRCSSRRSSSSSRCPARGSTRSRRR